MVDGRRVGLTDDLAKSLLTHVGTTLFEVYPQWDDVANAGFDLVPARNKWFESLSRDETGTWVAKGMPSGGEVMTAPAQLKETMLSFDTGYGGHPVKSGKLATNPTKQVVEIDPTYSFPLGLSKDCLRLRPDSQQSQPICELNPAVTIGPSQLAKRGLPAHWGDIKEGLVKVCKSALRKELTEGSDQVRLAVFYGYDSTPIVQAVQSAASAYLATTGLSAAQLQSGPEPQDEWIDLGDLGQDDPLTDVKHAAREYTRYFMSKYPQYRHKPRFASTTAALSSAKELTEQLLSQLPSNPPDVISNIQYSHALRRAG